MADNLNNFVRYVTFGKAVSQLCLPWWESVPSKAGETVIAVFAARKVPMYYNQFAWISGHAILDAGIGGTTTWTLYCSGKLYNGDHDFDVSYLGKPYSYGTLLTNSTSHAVPAALEGIEIHRGGDHQTYLVLTANNDSAGGMYSGISSIDIWPINGTLI